MPTTGDKVYDTFRKEGASLSDTNNIGNPEAADKTPLLSWTVLVQIGVILAIMLSVLFVAIGGAAVQVLDGVIPEFELNAWRFGVQWIIMIPVVRYRGCQVKVPCKTLPCIGLNILAQNFANIFVFTSYIYLPLGLADGLMNVVIIAGNTVLSICIKSDRKLSMYIGAVLGIIGLVFMIQPSFLFSGADLPPPPVTNWTSPCKGTGITSHSNTTVADYILPTPDTMGYVYVILASLSFIVYYLSAGWLVKDLDPSNISFWNAVAGTLISIVLMLIFEKPTFLQSKFCVAMLLIHCVGTTAVSMATYWSLQYISPSTCAMIESLKILFMIVFQYTILRNIKPGLQNWVEILGAIICFCGMLGGPLTDIITAGH